MTGDGDIVSYLRTRLPLKFGPDSEPIVTRLSGGVSYETLLVTAGAQRVVVKRALARLLVDADWKAKPERAMTEADAISLLHPMTPHQTPALLDADPATNTLVITAAPAEWVPWKDALLGDVADPSAGPAAIAAQLGAILSTWHRRTWQDPAIAARFNDHQAFEQLRLVPYHRAVAAAHPAAAEAIEQCAHELRTRRDCLVHGDYSPKNVLVGGEGLMVLDFEVAHTGAAVFDLAFLSCHLALKAMHMPERFGEFFLAAEVFVQTYLHGTERIAGNQAVTARLGWHTACLLLSRVDGMSRAEYLQPETAHAARRVALMILRSEDTSSTALWQAVAQAATPHPR